MTPKDETLTGETAAFVAALRANARAAAPEASAELRTLFATTAPVTAPPATTPRRTPVSDAKRLLTTIPSKVAAGALGALLAGSLGAGAMTGTITLTSNESDVAEVTEAQPEDENVGQDEALLVEDLEPAEEVEEVEAEDGEDGPKAAGDPTTAPIPTTVEEAAHNHHFDEACGNHGAYVSHFARTGEEPECATSARNGGAEASGAGLGGESETESEVRGPGRSDEGKAKAAAKGKGKGKGNAGR